MLARPEGNFQEIVRATPKTWLIEAAEDDHSQTRMLSS